jgi:trehalose 6-phosphate phosphatase
MSALPNPLPVPPAVSADWALFLDVDGTLLDFADVPGDVLVDPGLTDVLAVLHGRLDGALALVSGRRLAQLDELFAPLRLPATGLHGLERREEGHLEKHPRPRALDEAVAWGKALAQRYPGARVEDKGTTIALHWRAAPDAEDLLRQYADSILIDLPGYHLQPGNMVVELRPDGAHKGTAVIDMLQHPPFKGRRPVFVGDDLTDEHAFAAVNSHGGFGVLVGSRPSSGARYGLHDPAAVREWLEEGLSLV